MTHQAHAAHPAPLHSEALPPPPGGLLLASADAADTATIAAADRAARHWIDPEPGPVRLGSARHRSLACRMFRETFNPYKPSVIDWPRLSDEARERLVNLPIWDIAVQTEGHARLRMQSYADSLDDPDWRAAIAQNGWEEGRHRAVLSNLVQAYGIPLEPEPEYVAPRDREWAYLVTGFSECVDSFFAFGLFALAKRSGFFPMALVETFEPVIQEECRHILLFANWLAWVRRAMPWWRRPWFELRVAAAWVFLIWARAGMARGMEGGGDGKAGSNFTATSGKAMTDEDLDPVKLMRVCLVENERRFAGYDTRLRRPTTMPNLVRAALRVVDGWARLRGRPVRGA